MPPSYPLRPEVRDFEPYAPGLSIDEIRARFGLESVIKMASNENPLGVSPVVQKRVRDLSASIFRYAQSGTPRLIHALEEYHGLPAGHIVAGNGSDEIIDLLMRCCPSAGVHNVVACKPSFNMYRIQSKLCGVEFRSVPLRADFSFDWQGLLDAVDGSTALVFITTPDNPSGYCPSVAAVEGFARALPPNCLLVVDEAYMDFCRDESAFSLLPRFAEFSNLVILRTFSKSFGLAGIRLGYGIMPTVLAAAMRSIHMPFSVNILAEAAGMAALEDRVFYDATMQTVWRGKTFLTEGLESLGCHVFPSQANFLMFELPGQCEKSAKQVFEELLAQGVIIRPLHSYGLLRHLRVSMGNDEENAVFLREIKKCLE